LDAFVTQYCSSPRPSARLPRWFIRFSLPLPNGNDLPDWSACPGTLYQDYGSAAEAATAARWWGYNPVIAPHEHPAGC
jgi:hypothetical protein